MIWKIKNKLLQLIFGLINKLKPLKMLHGGAGITLYEFTCETCNNKVVEEDPGPECIACFTKGELS